MFYYTWKSNTYTWLKKQNKILSIMKVYIVISKFPPTAWLPGPLWRGSHCLCVYFWRLHAYTNLYVWICTCHLSLLKGDLLHTPFCTLLFHLKYFIMYCLTIGIDQFHSFTDNIEFIVRRLILTLSLKKLRYNLYRVKFTLFSIQFYKFWQTHTFLCNFDRFVKQPSWQSWTSMSTCFSTALPVQVCHQTFWILPICRSQWCCVII